MKKWKGLAASPGCIMGTAGVRAPVRIQVERREVEFPAREVELFEAVRGRYRSRLRVLNRKMAGTGREGAAIFEAYEEILGDEEFFSGVTGRVMAQGLNIDYVLEEEKRRTVEIFLGLEDEYLQERATDIANVCNELILGVQGKKTGFSPSYPREGKLILFAEDLTPEETVRMDRSVLGGIVTQRGGLTSHTVILARTLGIPAIVKAEGILEEVSDGMTVILYGSTGEVILSPGPEEIEAYNQSCELELRGQAEYERVRPFPAVTRDGIPVKVSINCGGGEDPIDLSGCDGVGLLRTEYLYLNARAYPSEEDQFALYRRFAEQAGEKELVIRTLDIGGDKQASYMPAVREDNPFLGYRAIRRSLDHPDLFKVQLRAILRAGAFGNVRLLFPMIVSVEELEEAKALLAEAMEELSREGIPFRRPMPVGMMIETPAAVWLAGDLARKVDFFSIGTNDLVQYTTAADRNNHRVQRLYEVCNPAVLRGIDYVCRCAQREGIGVTICGEAASDPLLVPLWVGMGVENLSVVPGQVPRVKYHINRTSREEMGGHLCGILGLSRAGEIREALLRLWERAEAAAENP